MNELTWLLESNEPWIRYHALTGLLDRPPTDPAVKKPERPLPATLWCKSYSPANSQPVTGATMKPNLTPLQGLWAC